MGKTTKKIVRESEVKRNKAFSLTQRKEPFGDVKFPFSHISHLQRTIGNQAVQRLFRSGTLQTKLKIGKPKDKYEREADRVATQVMREPEAEISRQTEEKEEEEPIRARINDSSEAIATPGVESSINSLKGGGQPLPESTRSYFEPRFGSNFSQVRVHNNSQAANVAESINARAFTTGKDVVFGTGQYSPETSSGKRLLAHELIHVIQQDRGKTDYKQNVNAAASQNISIQRQQKQSTWENNLTKAKRLIKSGNKSIKNKGIRLFKQLILEVAKTVSIPSPLQKRIPTIKDIRFYTSGWTRFDAKTDPNAVVDLPNNHWKWIIFYPSTLKNKSWTKSAIFHELDHAAHFKTIYNIWYNNTGKNISNKGLRRNEWKKFLVSYETKWKEKQINIPQHAAAYFSGLPSAINPSIIEFRAYGNQLVNFFHKLNLKDQAFIVKALILHYPLIKQSIKSGIRDPSMDLVKTRTKIINYFKNPPVKATQKIVIQILLCRAFFSATLYRSPSDITKIKKDFTNIFNSGRCKWYQKARKLERKSRESGRRIKIVDPIIKKYRPVP